MLDVNLIRMMRNRKDFNLLKQLIDYDTLDDKTRVLVKCFERYYDKLHSHESVMIEVFGPAF